MNARQKAKQYKRELEYLKKLKPNYICKTLHPVTELVAQTTLDKAGLEVMGHDAENFVRGYLAKMLAEELVQKVHIFIKASIPISKGGDLL